MAIRPITDTLRQLQGGLFIDRCSDMLAEAVLAVEDTGKAGKLTITLDLKKSAGAIEIIAKVSNKVPETKPDSDLLWSTPEGNLTAQNPKQQALDLRKVEDTPRPLRNVDPETGEIKTAAN